MDIDWSKAPEGATHYCMRDKAFWVQDATSVCSECIPRPERLHVEWNGEGLPPVGCECEVDDPALGDWNACSIKWVGREVAVVDRPDGGELCVLKQASNFRPLRTKEQRQREELIVLMAEMNGSEVGSLAETILARYNLEPKT